MKKFNFKWAIYVLICAVLLPVMCVCFNPKEKAFAESDFLVLEEASEIRMISGDFVGTQIFSSDDALDMLNQFKNTLGFKNSRDALKLNKVVQSVTGFVYRFDQFHNGTKVYGGELNVSVSSSGKAQSIMGSYYKDMAYNDEVNYSKEEAMQKVQEHYPEADVFFIETVIVKTEVSGYVAYVFEATNGDSTNKVFISARTLSLTKDFETNASLRDSLPTSGYTITSEETTQTNLNGESVTLKIDKYTSQSAGGGYFYVLSDNERQIFVTDGQQRSSYSGYKYYDSYMENAQFDDGSAVQAYQYIMDCYDFYADSSNFGVSIEGIENSQGRNTKLIVIMHYGVNYENAAFVPAGNSLTSHFVFGDGNSAYGTGAFVKGKDVVGHEYQHAITDSVVALEYMNASGALSEAYSDIFGAVIEGHDISEADFWRMGEDIYNAKGRYFRDMSNPAASDCTYSYNDLYPYCTSSSCSHTNCDNGGVHYNATLMTYATYIMYERNPEFFTTTNILKLWYQTLTKLTTTADFEDFAMAMMESAEDLGLSAENKRDIEFAFASIGLPGYTGQETWNGNTLTYLQGSGTLAKPFLINSVADLASVAYYVNTNEDDGLYRSARYKLNVDIDLDDVDWVGIGTSEYSFDGTFNGGYHTISGLNLTSTSSDVFAGLFRYTGVNAYIYDLIIDEGSTTSNAEYVGAIAGRLMGTITGCSSALDITGNKVGGLAGLVINAYGGQVVTNSFTTSDLTGTLVGGLVATFATMKNPNLGLHKSGYVSSNYTTGTLTGNVVGGLIGEGNGLYIANDITLATLKGSGTSATLGGFVGKMYFKNPIDTTESITQKVSNYVLSSKSTADFVISGTTYVGLIVGSITNTNPAQGNIYIENTIVKERDLYSYSSSSLTSSNIKIVNTKISTDVAYEGVFDFDSEKYYKDQKNWTVLSGIEAFDMETTFEVSSSGKMPKFQSANFWLDYNSSSFAGGDGSTAYPYQISTAEELALLAKLLFIDTTYSSYASANYILTADIDLQGKIWAGIGYTKITVENGITTSAILRPFKGTFNGNGYTIFNMTSVGAYSVSALNTTGSNYMLYEFLPALFGVTSVTFTGNEVLNPTIKNFTLENINARGSFASSVVSKAFYGVNIENVTVMGGNITSSGTAGGIIAKIDTTGESISGVSHETNIKNCYTLVNVSGVIVGGVVGYVSNVSTTEDTTLNIINHLNRGKISTTGDNYDTYYSAGSYAYYRPVAGSMVGITLVKELNLINCINMGDVVSYNENPMLGGFIGAIGVGDAYSQGTMTITVDGCKQMGDVYYIFDSTLHSDGAIIGYTHSNLASLVTLNVLGTTYTNQETSVVKEQNMIAFTQNSNLQISTDAVGEGDFDIYNKDYYSNPLYFNIDNAWGDAQTGRLFFTITFKNYDGSVIKVETIKEGETATLPTETPTRESTPAYEYVFTGWSESVDGVTRSMTVYAEFDEILRKYEITYVDEKGNVVDKLTLYYGTMVNQGIEAPEKKGNFFMDYTFLRWGEDGQVVTGEMKIAPVYKSSLTGIGTAIVFFVAIIVFAGIVALVSKKRI
ncbi:MAG: M4 family metallopeptidase [Clostridia bacterium]|nr:M4 family metallopeptidase [Clostridia bacterium]